MYTRKGNRRRMQWGVYVPVVRFPFSRALRHKACMRVVMVNPITNEAAHSGLLKV